jgi:hypothetical protein
MSLVTIAEVRAVVQTDRDDTQLQAIIDREEDEMVARLGDHGPDGATFQVRGGGSALYLSRPLASITSITERIRPSDTPVTVDPDTYWASGAGVIERAGTWAPLVTVVGIPADIARRKQVLIELVRLALEQTAMRSESVAGEYSYTAPEWERARADLMRRLTFMSI